MIRWILRLGHSLHAQKGDYICTLLLHGLGQLRIIAELAALVKTKVPVC